MTDAIDTDTMLEQLAPIFSRNTVLAPAQIAALVTPNANHQRLHALVGDWDAPSRFWLLPGMPPVESSGHAERKMVLGGRFLHETYEATVMGQPFRGLGFNGYDNFEQRYTAVWMDNLSTAIMTTYGTCDDSGSVLTFHGQHKDPLGGQPRPSRSTIEILHEDRYVLRIWIEHPDGIEHPLLEIDYRRL